VGKKKEPAFSTYDGLPLITRTRPGTKEIQLKKKIIRGEWGKGGKGASFWDGPAGKKGQVYSGGTWINQGAQREERWERSVYSSVGGLEKRGC